MEPKYQVGQTVQINSSYPDSRYHGKEDKIEEIFDDGIYEYYLKDRGHVWEREIDDIEVEEETKPINIVLNVTVTVRDWDSSEEIVRLISEEVKNKLKGIDIGNRRSNRSFQ